MRTADLKKVIHPIKPTYSKVGVNFQIDTATTSLDFFTEKWVLSSKHISRKTSLKFEGRFLSSEN